MNNKAQREAAERSAAARRLELDRLEPAARELCVLRGADPDTVVENKERQYGYEGPTADVYYQHPLWERAAFEIERHLQVQSALQITEFTK